MDLTDLKLLFNTSVKLRLFSGQNVAALWRTVLSALWVEMCVCVKGGGAFCTFKSLSNAKPKIFGWQPLRIRIERTLLFFFNFDRDKIKIFCIIFHQLVLRLVSKC